MRQWEVTDLIVLCVLVLAGIPHMALLYNTRILPVLHF
jgi:hypothetical protein